MEAGERVVIKRAGKPVARLVPMEEPVASEELQQKRRSLFGSMKGKLVISDDWDEPLPDSFWLGEDESK